MFTLPYLTLPYLLWEVPLYLLLSTSAHYLLFVTDSQGCWHTLKIAVATEGPGTWQVTRFWSVSKSGTKRQRWHDAHIP